MFLDRWEKEVVFFDLGKGGGAAPGDDDNGNESGSAYIFRFDGTRWVQEAKLRPSDGATGDLFGFSVWLSGDAALIGARNDADNGSESGSAYVFRFDGTRWIQEAKLLPSDGAGIDRFGQSVSLGGDVALIGAHGDDDNRGDSGSAYVFVGLGDCQPNDVLDLCDIADGSSRDDNGNGVPDECDETICEDITRFKVKVKDDRGRCKINASVKTSLPPGTELTICFEDSDCDCRTVEVNERGGAKAKCVTLIKGEHRVHIQECPQFSRNVTCAPKP